MAVILTGSGEEEEEAHERLMTLNCLKSCLHYALCIPTCSTSTVEWQRDDLGHRVGTFLQAERAGY